MNRKADDNRIRALILDMDGVLVCSGEPIGDLSAIFQEINRCGYGVMLCTNNSTRTASQFAADLNALGASLQPHQVINSSIAVGYYLKQVFPAGGPVFVVGERGLIDPLAEQGYYQNASDPMAVIVGLDRDLTYAKLAQAAFFIRKGTPFIGTNPDLTMPTPKGQAPGAGAIIGLLRLATDVEPVYIGKPEPWIYKVAIERLRLPPDQILVVGDRLETDIAGAQKLGCQSALVLTGVSTFEQARQWQPALDYLGIDLTTLLNDLTKK